MRILIILISHKKYGGGVTSSVLLIRGCVLQYVMSLFSSHLYIFVYRRQNQWGFLTVYYYLGELLYILCFVSLRCSSYERWYKISGYQKIINPDL